MPDASLKLYIKPWCPWCIKAVNLLDERGIAYEKIDVLSSRAAYDEMIQLSGQTLTPTLEWDGEVLADFGPEDLRRFLDTHKITA
ncbi:MAG: glutaredoxin family protein [Chthoniobacteraceae bacterium]